MWRLGLQVAKRRGFGPVQTQECTRVCARTSPLPGQCQIHATGNDRQGALNMAQRFVTVVVIATALFGSMIIAATGTSSAGRVSVAALTR